MRVKTEKKGRRIVAAEYGCCRRCGQDITPGERIINESGKFPSHRDCVRLHIALPRDREPQPSSGWGNPCTNCGGIIDRPAPWRKIGKAVAHLIC